jgi:hypothetical protein
MEGRERVNMAKGLFVNIFFFFWRGEESVGFDEELIGWY